MHRSIERQINKFKSIRLGVWTKSTHLRAFSTSNSALTLLLSRLGARTVSLQLWGKAENRKGTLKIREVRKARLRWASTGSSFVVYLGGATEGRASSCQ
jgi:hypothetical protein